MTEPKLWAMSSTRSPAAQERSQLGAQQPPDAVGDAIRRSGNSAPNRRCWRGCPRRPASRSGRGTGRRSGGQGRSARRRRPSTSRMLARPGRGSASSAAMPASSGRTSRYCVVELVAPQDQPQAVRALAASAAATAAIRPAYRPRAGTASTRARCMLRRRLGTDARHVQDTARAGPGAGFPGWATSAAF